MLDKPAVVPNEVTEYSRVRTTQANRVYYHSVHAWHCLLALSAGMHRRRHSGSTAFVYDHEPECKQGTDRKKPASLRATGGILAKVQGRKVRALTASRLGDGRCTYDVALPALSHPWDPTRQGKVHGMGKCHQVKADGWHASEADS